MSKTLYTKEHEWLRIEDDGLVTVGITDYAQDHLGDIVYVQLPASGNEFNKGAEICVIESVKTAGEILMPAAGAIVEINETLGDDPAKVNNEPMAGGWFFRFKPAQASDLEDGFLDEGGYKAYIESLG